MCKITAENFDERYVDKVELSEIDKFVCNEMSRQIHRYIKGMSGSKVMMEKFETSLSKLSSPQREEAIANYKFGIRNHEGKILVHPLYDFLRTPYVYIDDLCLMPVIAEKNKKMGLILPDGKDTVIAEFIYDDMQLRSEPPYFEGIIGRKHVLIDRYGTKHAKAKEDKES